MSIETKIEENNRAIKNSNDIMHQANIVMEQAGAEIIRLDELCEGYRTRIRDLKIYRANCRNKLIELGENPDTLDEEGF
tara:strand:+ start:124 stop:360 length:237 start_codon:yes stop_codon:yes gene_type:complete